MNLKSVKSNKAVVERLSDFVRLEIRRVYSMTRAGADQCRIDAHREFIKPYQEELQTAHEATFRYAMKAYEVEEEFKKKAAKFLKLNALNLNGLRVPI
jgi:predicted HTH transcriptional regulator